jgi:hypothetical protein
MKCRPIFCRFRSFLHRAPWDCAFSRTDRSTRAAVRYLRGREPRQSGYALLLVLFMMTVMLITSTAVLMNRRTQGTREREDQMIWRGKQFVRAIRIYYRKTGHYPQDLDMLEKGVGNLHFIRPEALKDPMNRDEDGKWRFIYTNAAGQIMGSVKYATMQQMAVLDLYSAQIAAMKKAESESDDSFGDQNGFGSTTNCQPGSPSSPASPAGQPAAPQSGPGAPSQVLPPAPAPTSPFNSFSLGGNSTAPGQSGCGPQLPGMPAMAPAALKALLDMKPTGPVDSPVIGGFLVGVGSTVDRASVKVYKGGTKYQQWEFIYNPIEEQALAIQQGMSQGGAPVNPVGGGMFGSPAPASPTPPMSQPQPPQPQPPQNWQ